MPSFEAACAGVWLHGECGREAGPGLISEDLAEQVPAVYRRLFSDIGEKRN
jgi:NAD(P)H-hydrate repair Nnr-like enzyme with NAD(P)H-hydrate dehydratase domain